MNYIAYYDQFGVIASISLDNLSIPLNCKNSDFCRYVQYVQGGGTDVLPEGMLEQLINHE